MTGRGIQSFLGEGLGRDQVTEIRPDPDVGEALVPSSPPQSIQHCALAYFGGMRGVRRKQAVIF